MGTTNTPVKDAITEGDPIIFQIAAEDGDYFGIISGTDGDHSCNIVFLPPRVKSVLSDKASIVAEGITSYDEMCAQLALLLKGKDMIPDDTKKRKPSKAAPKTETPAASAKAEKAPAKKASK